MARDDKRIKRRVRHSYIISTVSIAMVLFLLGWVAFLMFNALAVTDRLKESVTFYVMLDDGLTEKQMVALRDAIAGEQEVREVVYVSKEEAAKQFIAETGEDFSGFIEFNPLPDSFEVGLRANLSDKEVVGAFEAKIAAMAGVSEVIYQKGVIDQISSNINKFNLALLLFGAGLLVISLILLNNTVRMTIISRRQIINTMKLVGATRGFILRPFLSAAAGNGVVAGLIATGLFAVMLVGLREGLPEVAMLQAPTLLGSIAVGMIVGGVVISLLFTAFAVNKFVRMSGSKMYLY
ncbi:MAG: permease-like cell division protein FtsX [Rikenellaceae bacterium]|jgi:cell division transport system permease protein|nr:permease-like cell division protein FtsX [Rikenellaceae bacterium]